MTELIVTTYDWVPDLPRGYVRDIRALWALEEANLPYRLETTPFKNRDEEHFSKHPFGQVPWLTDGDLTVFESGAILFHLGEKSETLMPATDPGRSEVIQWLFAALNSVEMASLPYSIFKFSDDTTASPGRQALDAFLESRLGHMDTILSGRDYIAGAFSIADIAMADVLRLVDRFDGLASYPACRAYVERLTQREAFLKSHAKQIAHFEAAD